MPGTPRAAPPLLPFDLEAIAFKEKGPDYLFPGEMHQSFELCYVDRGPVSVLVDRVGFGGMTGDLFLFFPGQEHILWADTRTAPNIVSARFRLPENGRGYTDLRRLKKGPVRATPRMRDLVGMMLEAGSLSNARSQALARVHLAELLLVAPSANMASGAKLRSRIVENGQKRIAQAAERFMLEHLAEPVRIADIARMIAVSESTLRHGFKRATEHTVADRLEELRASRAKVLLRESGLSVTEISRLVGYPSIHSFSRAFKRLTKMSPEAYSRSIR